MKTTMKKMTKAERIYEATRRECKDIITGTYGYSEGQKLSGLATEEVVCMRTINAIMKLVDKEEHRIRLDEELGVLSGEKLQLYINVNNMVRSTVENVKKSLKKFLDDLKPNSEYSKWLDERVEAMEAQEKAEETTAEESSEVETVEQAQESKDTFEYRNYIISGNERTGIIAIDNHGNFSPNVYRTVEEAKKAVDEDIECAERKYAEMEAAKQAEPVDYSKFFIDRGAESPIVKNENGIFEVVLGHTEDDHTLLSVTESGKYEYDVAVYRIDTHGNVDSVPIEYAHFKNFGSCRRYYKTIMNKFIGDDHLADKNRKHSAGVKRHSLLGMLAGAK